MTGNEWKEKYSDIYETNYTIKTANEYLKTS